MERESSEWKGDQNYGKAVPIWLPPINRRMELHDSLQTETF